MAQLVINIGAAPNDGTGDTIRAAYDKANQNFTETYANAAAAQAQANLGVANAAAAQTTANAAQPAASAAPKRHPGYIVNNWYVPYAAVTAAGQAMPVNTGKFLAFMVDQDVTIQTLSARVVTVGTTTFQLAIYAADPVTLKPTGFALGYTANISNLAAANLTANLNVNVSLQKGKLYYFASISGDVTALYIAYLTVFFHPWLLGSTTTSLLTTSGNVPNNHYSCPVTYPAGGAWPDVSALTFTELANNAIIGPIFKVFSVP